MFLIWKKYKQIWKAKMKTILNFEGKNPKVYFTKILISYQKVYNTKFFITVDVVYCVLIQEAYFSVF